MARPRSDHPLSDAARQARRRARFAEEVALLKAAARPVPVQVQDPALLQATATELARQQRRTGELERENEALRAEVARRTPKSAPVNCAFCLKTGDQVAFLIPGERSELAMICNECVARCADHIAKREAERAGHSTLTSRPG